MSKTCLIWLQLNPSSKANSSGRRSQIAHLWEALFAEVRKVGSTTNFVEFLSEIGLRLSSRLRLISLTFWFASLRVGHFWRFAEVDPANGPIIYHILGTIFASPTICIQIITLVLNGANICPFLISQNPSFSSTSQLLVLWISATSSTENDSSFVGGYRREGILCNYMLLCCMPSLFLVRFSVTIVFFISIALWMLDILGGASLLVRH